MVSAFWFSVYGVACGGLTAGGFRLTRSVSGGTHQIIQVGGREPLIVDYDVGFDDAGKVTAIAYNVYMEVRTCVGGWIVLACVWVGGCSASTITIVVPTTRTTLMHAMLFDEMHTHTHTHIPHRRARRRTTRRGTTTWPCSGSTTPTTSPTSRHAFVYVCVTGFDYTCTCINISQPPHHHQQTKTGHAVRHQDQPARHHLHARARGRPGRPRHGGTSMHVYISVACAALTPTSSNPPPAGPCFAGLTYTPITNTLTVYECRWCWRRWRASWGCRSRRCRRPTFTE